MPIYPVPGYDTESRQTVKVEMGYAEGVGYFFGVDQGDREIASATHIWTLADLINRTRQYVKWDRRLYNAMRDLPSIDFMLKHPGTPVAKILQQVR